MEDEVEMGDFNVNIGKKESEENRIEHHGVGTTNIQVIENLRVKNTYFNKKPNRKWTSITATGETKK